MPQINDVGALRDWLRTCPVIPRESAFGVDYLGDTPDGYALCSMPAEAKYRENILGETALLPRQNRDFRLDARMPYGADPGQNLDNLARMRAIADWIRTRSAEGELPAWSAGRVIAVVPGLSAGPTDVASGTARYRMGLRVVVEMSEPGTGNGNS